jgi:hypothetical protein
MEKKRKLCLESNQEPLSPIKIEWMPSSITQVGYGMAFTGNKKTYFERRAP